MYDYNWIHLRLINASNGSTEALINAPLKDWVPEFSSFTQRSLHYYTEPIQCRGACIICDYMLKQECIPVGCVTPAAVASIRCTVRGSLSTGSLSGRGSLWQRLTPLWKHCLPATSFVCGKYDSISDLLFICNLHSFYCMVTLVL